MRASKSNGRTEGHAYALHDGDANAEKFGEGGLDGPGSAVDVQRREGERKEARLCSVSALVGIEDVQGAGELT